MNEMTAWAQGNWYELGNLLAQFSFLIAGVWFALKILKAARSLQEQLGAILKLSMSEGLKQNAPARSSAYVLAEWPTATEAAVISLPEPEPRHKRLIRAWHSVILWLKTPMGAGDHPHWRRVLHWLQSPAGS
ncbi:MAG TPA: hypothetical protein VMH48_05705 [Methylomirabilota bacterium]|nr:hypothetical protein [Methylomirabilota bacterium]